MIENECVIKFAHGESPNLKKLLFLLKVSDRVNGSWENFHPF